MLKPLWKRWWWWPLHFRVEWLCGGILRSKSLLSMLLNAIWSCYTCSFILFSVLSVIAILSLIWWAITEFCYELHKINVYINASNLKLLSNDGYFGKNAQFCFMLFTSISVTLEDSILDAGQVHLLLSIKIQLLMTEIHAVIACFSFRIIINSCTFQM